jgi:hypothetical protein
MTTSLYPYIYPWLDKDLAFMESANKIAETNLA